MIKGVSHITFVVQDIERTTLFFQKIFDAEMIYDSKEKTFSLSMERFFLVGDVWIAAMQGDSLEKKTYNHTAFQIEESDFERYKNRIEALGVEMREPRSRVDGEGRSLYFYDYDNHLFELHTGTLEGRLRAYEQESV